MSYHKSTWQDERRKMHDLVAECLQTWLCKDIAWSIMQYIPCRDLTECLQHRATALDWMVEEPLGSTWSSVAVANWAPDNTCASTVLQAVQWSWERKASNVLQALQWSWEWHKASDKVRACVQELDQHDCSSCIYPRLMFEHPAECVPGQSVLGSCYNAARERNTVHHWPSQLQELNRYLLNRQCYCTGVTRKQLLDALLATDLIPVLRVEQWAVQQGLYHSVKLPHLLPARRTAWSEQRLRKQTRRANRYRHALVPKPQIEQ